MSLAARERYMAFDIWRRLALMDNVGAPDQRIAGCVNDFPA